MDKDALVANYSFFLIMAVNHPHSILEVKFMAFKAYKLS